MQQITSLVEQKINKVSPSEIIVDKSTIYRDVGFYILSTLVTIWFATLGYIYWWSAAVNNLY